MEYVDCFECGSTGFLWLLIAALVGVAFLGGRQRNWTLVAGLLGVPLAVWYTDDLPTALVTLVALLLVVLSGTWFGSRRTKPARSDAA